MNICLIGMGFVGTSVAWRLCRNHKVLIISSNKDFFGYGSFQNADFIINCAGNSRRYRAEQDFDAAWKHEEKVFERIEELYKLNPKAKLLHVSSICATDDSLYGLTKRDSEFLAQNFPSTCILRLGGLVGKGLAKNVVYDLQNDIPLRVTLQSKYNFMHTAVVAQFIEYLIEHWKPQETITFTASRNITVERIAALMNKVPQIEPTAVTEYYDTENSISQTLFKTESSEHYIRQYLDKG